MVDVARTPGAPAAGAAPRAEASPPISELLRLQRAAGNRAVSRLVLQMNGANDSADEAETLDRSAELLKARHGDAVAVVAPGAATAPDLSGLAPDETVYVLGHSTGYDIGGKTADELAVWLAAALPDGFHGKIVLVACRSADNINPAAARGPRRRLGPMSYARTVAYRLHAIQQESPGRGLAVPEVRGRPGTSTLDPVTGARRAYPTDAVAAATNALVAAWSEPRKAVIKRIDDRLGALKGEMTAARRHDDAGELYAARLAVQRLWRRLGDRALSQCQLEAGALAGRDASVDFRVATDAPAADRGPRTTPAPAPDPAVRAAIDAQFTEATEAIERALAQLASKPGSEAAVASEIRGIADAATPAAPVTPGAVSSSSPALAGSPAPAAAEPSPPAAGSRPPAIATAAPPTEAPQPAALTPAPAAAEPPPMEITAEEIEPPPVGSVVVAGDG
jgi:hypothetical protein